MRLKLGVCLCATRTRGKEGVLRVGDRDFVICSSSNDTSPSLTRTFLAFFSLSFHIIHPLGTSTYVTYVTLKYTSLINIESMINIEIDRLRTPIMTLKKHLPLGNRFPVFRVQTRSTGGRTSAFQ